MGDTFKISFYLFSIVFYQTLLVVTSYLSTERKEIDSEV